MFKIYVDYPLYGKTPFAGVTEVVRGLEAAAFCLRDAVVFVVDIAGVGAGICDMLRYKGWTVEETRKERAA